MNESQTQNIVSPDKTNTNNNIQTEENDKNIDQTKEVIMQLIILVFSSSFSPLLHSYLSHQQAPGTRRPPASPPRPRVVGVTLPLSYHTPASP